MGAASMVSLRHGAHALLWPLFVRSVFTARPANADSTDSTHSTDA